MATLHCMHCGVQIPEDAVFCPKCGGQQEVNSTANTFARTSGGETKYYRQEALPQQQPQQHVTVQTTGFAQACLGAGAGVIIGVLILALLVLWFLSSLCGSLNSTFGR